MTRALLLTSGSRGDVQPFVALGQGLRRAGMEVRLCTHERFRGLVEAHGLDYAPMSDGLLELGDTQTGRALTEGGGNPLRALREVRPIVARTLREAEAAAEGRDLIVYHPKALAGSSLAEARGVPGVMALPAPAMTPTREFALPLLGDRSFGGLANRLSYAPLRLATLAFRGELDRWRRGLGLLPGRPLAPPWSDARGRPVPTLYPVSPHVVARPADWPGTTRLTGYWFAEGDGVEAPSPELAAFLAAGPPPVAIGFGSMAGRAAQRRTRAVLEGVERAGVRAVLVRGWGGLDAPERLPASVHVTSSAPYAWLFPRVAAVVHHGGAGATAEGLRAGVPTLVCPFFGDQPYWGGRVHALGVGPAPVPQGRLSGVALAEALRRMLDDGAMRERAARLGRAIREEDGVGNAVAYLASLA